MAPLWEHSVQVSLEDFVQEGVREWKSRAGAAGVMTSQIDAYFSLALKVVTSQIAGLQNFQFANSFLDKVL